MKLIDKDALLEKLSTFHPDYTFNITAFRNFVNAEPVIEQKKGKWIRREKVYPNLPKDSDYMFECSLCGWSDQHNDKMIVPYCWHCGAEMEESEESEESDGC